MGRRTKIVTVDADEAATFWGEEINFVDRLTIDEDLCNSAPWMGPQQQ